MGTLASCNPYFVRCIKPNPAKKPHILDANMTIAQLKYSGMLETIRVRKAGFAVRTKFDDFTFRYGMIVPSYRSLPLKDGCAHILKGLKEIKPDSWVLGVTKVFMKTATEIELEKQREGKIIVYVRVLQAFAKRVLAKKRLEYKRNAAIKIQKGTCSAMRGTVRERFAGAKELLDYPDVLTIHMFIIFFSHSRLCHSTQGDPSEESGGQTASSMERSQNSQNVEVEDSVGCTGPHEKGTRGRGATEGSSS